MKYPHLAARLFNTPLLIHPVKLDAILAGLGTRLLAGGIDLTVQRPAPPAVMDPKHLAATDPQPIELYTARQSTERSLDRPAYEVVDGVALINIHGALAHRTSIDADSTPVLGYQKIARSLDAAMGDEAVHSILLDVDSPGGEVAGAFELAAQVREANASKPVYAIADSLAASAGYLIISGARKIALAPTAYVGSIGVVMTHVDLSRALANDGLTVTHIYAGAHKVDGSPYQPLPAVTRERFQADIDAIYGDFVAAVAKGRGLSPAAVRATEAAVLRAEPALAAGLADRVITTDALLAELAARRPRSFPVGQPARPNVITGEHPMTKAKLAGAYPDPAPTDIIPPADDAPPAAPEAVETTSAESDAQPAASAGADLSAAQQAGADAERARIFAILDADAAKERPKAALTLARQPAISAATAVELLAGLPTETAPAASGNEFARAMAAIGNPHLRPDDESRAAAPSAAWNTIITKLNARSHP